MRYFEIVQITTFLKLFNKITDLTTNNKIELCMAFFFMNNNKSVLLHTYKFVEFALDGGKIAKEKKISIFFCAYSTKERVKHSKIQLNTVEIWRFEFYVLSI